MYLFFQIIHMKPNKTMQDAVLEAKSLIKLIFCIPKFHNSHLNLIINLLELFFLLTAEE